jgi:hypothetical protein
MTRGNLIRIAFLGAGACAGSFALFGCSSLPPTFTNALTGAGVSTTTVSKISSVSNAGYQAGQIFCQAAGSVMAATDATTGKPILATGATSKDVQNVCNAIYPSSIPTPPPQVPTVVPAVAVTPAPTTAVAS